MRPVNGLQSESPRPGRLWGPASPGRELRGGEGRPCLGLTSPDGAGMHRCREPWGPGARREFDCDITKGLLTALHPREATETRVGAAPTLRAEA